MFYMKIIYFDNAATSHYKPRCVIKAFLKAVRISANPGRSGHKLSLKNANIVYKTREIIAKHFGNIDNSNVIFTKNCTEALNFAILGLCKSGNVISTVLEHNSVLRPLYYLQSLGKITLTLATPKNKKFITKDDILPLIQKDTKLICVGAFSNVTGNQNDITSIGHLCREKNILFLVDDAQGVGHAKVDMKKQNINYLTFSGHKGFLTPQGIGALCVNNSPPLSPTLLGGTGTDSISLKQPKYLPEGLESGTLATTLISSLYSGIKYVEKHFIKHSKRVEKLTEYLIEQLSLIEGIKIYTTHTKTGVVGFNYKDIESEQLSDYLDKNYNIATRAGLHCAGQAHKFFGTVNQGIVRVSLCFKNKKSEIKKLIKAIRKYKKK